MTALLALLRTALDTATPAVLVRVCRALGSTPREVGAAMLVTREASVGTVGGGALELAGIVRARAMIEAGVARDTLAVPLGPAIGQCCGGYVTLALDRVEAEMVAREIEAEAARLAQNPCVLVFGAGHTGRALAAALAPLPLRVRLVDTRPAALAGLCQSIVTRAVAVPEAEVADAPAGSAFLVMTHDHGLDFLVAAAALSRGDAAYVGMIGSATKREKFRRHLAESGRGALISGLTLPIGRPASGQMLRDKRPEVIAAMAAAEVTAVLLARAEEKQALPLAGGRSQCNSEPIDRRQPKARHARAS